MMNYQKMIDAKKQELKDMDVEISKIHQTVDDIRAKDENQDIINYDKCFAIVKTTGVQCGVKSKKTSDFCGRHEKMDKVDIRDKVKKDKDRKDNSYWFRKKMETMSQKYKITLETLVQKKVKLQKEISDLFDQQVKEFLERSRQSDLEYEMSKMTVTKNKGLSEFDRMLEQIWEESCA